MLQFHRQPARQLLRPWASAPSLVAAVLALALSAPVAGAGTAYVTNSEGETVSVINTATNKVENAAIRVPSSPIATAMAPDGKHAYVVSGQGETVSVIDTATKTRETPAITVQTFPFGIGITPDGSRAYVVSALHDNVSVIDTATRALKMVPDGAAINVGTSPSGIAVSPDGTHAYVANQTAGTVSVINTASNDVEGPAIPVGREPRAIGIAPDGAYVYVTNFRDNTVSVISTATKTVEGTIVAGNEPFAIATSSDGAHVYVVNRRDNTVSVINTATNTVGNVPDGTAIKVGEEPRAIAVTPDGSRAYVVNQLSDSVSVINTVTNKVEIPAIPVGNSPTAVAITPNQPPLAAPFDVPSPVRPGVPFSLSAVSSKDPDGSVATYAWSFGDGQSQTLGEPTVTHTYSSPGTYSVNLTVTDNEHCSTTNSFVFTGQSPLGCIGALQAARTEPIKVTGLGRAGARHPRVRLSCPKKAKPRGCRFRLVVVAKKPKRRHKPKILSQVAKAKLPAGSSKIVSLVAKPDFRDTLATATSVLVRQSGTVGTATRTRYRRLPIVGQG
jgi:YVTN family beta-propeller protein